MQITRFTGWYVALALLMAVSIPACQKEQTESRINNKKALAVTDSTFNATHNYLAIRGTLTIKIQDSVYSFNAAKDSVAFVNMSEGDDHYYGITAVNKDHTMSFAVSSKGLAASEIISRVEGSQLLFSTDVMHPRQYTLTQYAGPDNAGKLTLDAYKRDSTLAKGTFITFLAKDDKPNSAFYKVEGRFDLQIK